MTAATITTDALTRVRALLPGRAEWQTLRRNPRRDLVAGVTVAVVALPLALAFGISSGMGAGAGLVTAVVAGAVAAVFGGQQRAGLRPDRCDDGGARTDRGPVRDVRGACARADGRCPAAGARDHRSRPYIRFLPLPVVEGFLVGIACVIGLQQVPAALGVPSSGGKVLAAAVTAVRDWLADPQWAEPALAGFVIVVMLVGVRYRPSWPLSLPAVVITAVVVAVANIAVPLIGHVPAGLPQLQAPDVPWGHLNNLVLPAVAVAALGALESLLSATVADGMTVGEHHNPHKELAGQGLANLAVPWFGGIPATAAIARTAVNVRSGARSRLAAFTYALGLLLVMVALAPLVAQIPLAALAGVLLATAFLMVEVTGLRAIVRSTRGDAVVLVLTALATLVFDLVTAVILGLVLAGFFVLQQVARSSRMDQEEVVLDDGHGGEEAELLARAHRRLPARRFPVLRCRAGVPDGAVGGFRRTRGHLANVSDRGSGRYRRLSPRQHDRPVGVAPNHGPAVRDPPGARACVDPSSACTTSWPTNATCSRPHRKPSSTRVTTRARSRTERGRSDRSQSGMMAAWPTESTCNESPLAKPVPWVDVLEGEFGTGPE